MSRVCEHGHDLFLQSRFIVGKVDRVAERLGHLGLAVCPRESEAGFVRRQIDLRLYEHITVVQAVEASDDLSALLEHRLLVFSYRNDRCLECGDIACLADRICEKAYRNALALEASHLDLGFYCRVSLYS